MNRVNRPPAKMVLLIQLFFLLIVLALAEFLVDRGMIDKLFLAAPSRIATELGELLKGFSLFQHLWVTIYEFGIGFAVAILAGVGGGLFIARVAAVDEFTRPFIAALMALPKVVIVPMLMVWLGIGPECKMAFVFLFSFFAILYNTIAGVKQTPENYLKVARVLGATRYQTVTKVMIPAAVPAIFAGLRVAAAGGFMGALFGEMLASQEGLGNLLSKAAAFYNTAQLLAVVCVITLVSVCIIKGLDALEKRIFLSWKNQ